jgi:hypothetical protein
MNKSIVLLTFVVSFTCIAADPALTIYNQNFAVVRETVPLNLKAGATQVQFVGATAHLEPSSVILRDPAGKHAFQILEQNYRNDPASQAALLVLNEGKTINFEITKSDGAQVRREIVPGKIVRAGYQYGGQQNYYGGYNGGTTMEPIIEMDGKLRFGLPGQPLFPALADESILRPALGWTIASTGPARFDAQLSYVTEEMSWEADYNLALPEKGNKMDLMGWVTVDNRSGKVFENAKIKLMAGDVSKVQDRSRLRMFVGGGSGGVAGAPVVSEKSFDEYHLYTLERPATLHDREKKQVEFARATDVNSEQIYVYDGATQDPDQPRWWEQDQVQTEAKYGSQSYKKVWAFREFSNSVPNHLGIPLPKGKVRIYRRNTDGQMEFVGENLIQHTPRNELVRLFTGSAFDLVGGRKQTAFAMESDPVPRTDPKTGLPLPSKNPAPAFDPATGFAPPATEPASGVWNIFESFEITLRNHKTEPVEIRVVEHLCRHHNWEITVKSDEFKKTEARTVEFGIKLKPEEERKVTYTVHYWW